MWIWLIFSAFLEEFDVYSEMENLCLQSNGEFDVYSEMLGTC